MSKRKAKIAALNRVIKTLEMISSRVKLHPVDEIPHITESILTCRLLILELETGETRSPGTKGCRE